MQSNSVITFIPAIQPCPCISMVGRTPDRYPSGRLLRATSQGRYPLLAALPHPGEFRCGHLPHGPLVE
eukprot:3795588-Karenia_brevis.AAC.1